MTQPPLKERIPDTPHTKTEKCLGGGGGGWAGGGSGLGTVGQARGVEESRNRQTGAGIGRQGGAGRVGGQGGASRVGRQWDGADNNHSRGAVS